MLKTKPHATVVRKSVLLLGLMVFCGCSAAPVKKEPQIPAKRPVSEYVKADVTYAVKAYDPWEGFNRRIYKFNAKFDQYIFLPVIRGYEFITPGFVQTAVTNFFNNLWEVRNLMNSLFQLKGQKFANTIGRIFVNTTVGFLGIQDPATAVGLAKANEDFGQTLGHYGVGPGPYLVLPVLGPSGLRDTGGLIVDTVAYSLMTNAIINHAFDMSTGDEDKLKYGLSLLNAIDRRRNLSFRYYQTGSPFEYDLVRMLYLTKRQLLIAD
ncbi:MAG: VacJ family lipoprotein [Desulfobacterales bacterium]|nr:MAG: VacJ family lipoprotein [Desulfobacterales bacterium]